MKTIRIFLLLSLAALSASMMPQPQHRPVNGSLDPSLCVVGDISDDELGFYFVVWRASDLNSYSKYDMTVVSSVCDKDTVVVAANHNGGARYLLTDMDRDKEAPLSFWLKDEKGKIVSRGTVICEEGKVARLTFDTKLLKTKNKQ